MVFSTMTVERYFSFLFQFFSSSGISGGLVGLEKGTTWEIPWSYWLEDLISV